MNDSFSIVSQYMSNIDRFKLSKSYVKIPETVHIQSIEHYERFKSFCRTFKTNITTVLFTITTNVKANRNSYSIDYVPESVRNVKILSFDPICPFTWIRLPDTVESLEVDNTFANIETLPKQIRHLTLGHSFEGVVMSFESNLNTLCLCGYNSGGRLPCPIDDLPDTIQTMTIYENFPAHITYYPENVTIVFLH